MVGTASFGCKPLPVISLCARDVLPALAHPMKAVLILLKGLPEVFRIAPRASPRASRLRKTIVLTDGAQAIRTIFPIRKPTILL